MRKIIFVKSIFLSKLISVIGFFGQGSAAENNGNVGANDGRHDANDKEGRTIEEKEIFLNSKLTSKIGFEQSHNSKRTAVNPASLRTGVRRNSAKKSKSGERLFLLN